MKKSSGFFRGMFDGLRSTVSQPSTGSKSEADFDETLKAENFRVAKIVRHGFPYQPTALAFDPIQRLIAIGTKNGSLRILGRPGVDIHVQHIPEYAVIQILFLMNEGSLITVLADDSLHLWSLRSKPPEIVYSLKFQKERITYCHLSFQSKWLYIGTERGNVHVVNIDTFMLSGYVINWNKAIELSRKTHPGSIVHLSDCPIDSNKLLIGYESGCIVFWDLRNKSADFRNNYTECLKSISWHHEGRQFICSHNDGSLTTWNIKGGAKPLSVVYPHSKAGPDMKSETCKPIYKTEWKTVRNGDSYIIFSGGLPYQPNQSNPNQVSQSPQSSSSSQLSPQTSKLDKLNGTQSLTVIHGKTTTVLEMEHNIIDFITLCESPYETDFNDPFAIVVLLFNDLVVVDLLSPGYPCFQNPYSMDLHESPVTYCYYLADCPTDLVRAFFSVGHKGTKRSGFSEKDWPINGGEWGSSTVSYPEIIITGHADGSIKFWDASSVHLQVLYKLKTSKLFEKPKLNSSKSMSDPSQQQESVALQESDDPFAVEQLAFCTDGRYLCVGGASSQVIVFRFSKHEAHTEVSVIEIAMNYENEPELDSAENEGIATGISSLLTQGSSDSHSHEPNTSPFYSLTAKSGHHKRVPGFQCEMVCLSPWIDRNTPPYRITSLCINTYASLIAYGTENGLVIIDMIQKCSVLNVSTPNLYGASDPYQRIIRSAKRTTSTGLPTNRDNSDGNQSDADRCKSPTSEQCMNDECRSTDTSVPNTPLLQTHFDIPSAPIPPPRTKKKRNSETSVKDQQNLNENLVQINSDLIEINNDQNVDSAKSVPNIRPNDLNLQLSRKCSRSRSLAKDMSPIMTSVDSDDQSLQSNNTGIGSSPSSPIDYEPNEKSLIKSNNINQKFGFNDKCDKLSNNTHNKDYKKKKNKIIDLRLEDKEDSMVSRIFNKIDSSFSRSRSSSISSLENIAIESVQYIAFADTYCTKSDATTSPCLWVGTSLGSVLVISLTLPDSPDNRILCLQAVIACPSGIIYRLKGSILCISFMDFTGSLLQLNSEIWKDSSKAGNTTPSSASGVESKRGGSLAITRSGSGGGSGSSVNRNNKISPTSSSTDMRDSQFVVMVSEKQIRLINLPSQVCAYKATITETSFAVRADVVYMKSADSLCLAIYLGTGNIVVFSLPSLRLLMDIDFLPLTDVRIARTLCFSGNGHGLYLSSPSELTKFTISSSICDNIPTMVGALFIAPKELPEQPKPSFLKGLFGGGSGTLDREELFGESVSGKPSKTTARHIPGNPDLNQMKNQVSGFGAELSRLREGLSERGEKIGQLEDKTARMQSEAEVFSSAAHNVMLKYRDKKWYQF